MLKNILVKSAIVISACSPLALYAATGNLATLIDQIIAYANRILVLLMAVAVVMFVYYIIKYFIMTDANRVEGGKYVMYSLIGFFIILSFWGLVNILQNTFGLKNEDNRPSGWNSFTNIFPGGGSNSGSNSGSYVFPSGNTSNPITAPAMNSSSYVNPTGNSSSYVSPTGNSNTYVNSTGNPITAPTMNSR